MWFERYVETEDISYISISAGYHDVKGDLKTATSNIGFESFPIHFINH